MHSPASRYAHSRYSAPHTPFMLLAPNDAPAALTSSPLPPCPQFCLSIGMWALLNQKLTRFPFTYDGPDPKYNGTTVEIAYCTLSSSFDQNGSQWGRCTFATIASACQGH